MKVWSQKRKKSKAIEVQAPSGKKMGSKTAKKAPCPNCDKK